MVQLSVTVSQLVSASECATWTAEGVSVSIPYAGASLSPQIIKLREVSQTLGHRRIRSLTSFHTNKGGFLGAQGLTVWIVRYREPAWAAVVRPRERVVKGLCVKTNVTGHWSKSQPSAAGLRASGVARVAGGEGGKAKQSALI